MNYHPWVPGGGRMVLMYGGVDVWRCWQRRFDDDRWGRRQIIAAVSNAFLPDSLSCFIAIRLAPALPICLLHLTLHSPHPSYCTSLYISLLPLCPLIFSSQHAQSVWFPEGKVFSLHSEERLDVAIKLSEIMILAAISPGSSLHPALIRRHTDLFLTRL